MRKLIFFSLFLLPAFQFVFAQPDFRDGFIVTNQRDTIFLRIDYSSQSRNYESCHTKEEGGIKKYGPDELLGYGFVNDKYFTSGLIEGSFVEVLVSGELSLYRDHNSYYAKKDEELYHLEEKVSKTGSGATPGIRTSTRWKGLLTLMINDCLVAQDVLKKLRFDERRITNLVIQYNTCRQSPFTVYKATKPWTKVQVGLAAGMIRSTLAVDNDYKIPYLDDQYHSLNPSIGLVVAISSPRVSDKIAFQPEVHVSQADYSSMRVQQEQAYTMYDDTYINVTTISTPVSMRYSFPERKYSVQVNVGVIFDSHIKSDTRVVREFVADGVVTTIDGDAFEIRKNQVGYIAGFAMMRLFSKFKTGLLLRYAGLGDFSGTLSLPVRTNKLSLSLILQMK